MELGQVQGLWKRDWLKSDAKFDSSTQVFWAQSGTQFVDIRIPEQRPTLEGKSCLEDLDASELLQLVKAEGFAGNISLNNSVCTWNREINWHGQSDDIDAGKLWFPDQCDVLIEDGIHADYQEQWNKVPTQGFQARSISVEDMDGFLLWSTTRFIYGLGVPEARSSGKVIEELHNQIISPDAFALFESEYCIGRWQGDIGISELCTNPFSENQVTLQKQDGAVFWRQFQSNGHEVLHQIG